MKKIILFFIGLILASYSFAQISGISSSKLSAINISTVQKNTIEFEPSFSISSIRKQWDSNGNLISLSNNGDSTSTFLDLSFRFSYGVSEKLEIGASIPVDADQISLGFKYQLPLRIKKLSFGIMGGANIPLENKTYDTDTNLPDNTTAIALGSIMSYDLGKRTSLDINLIYQDFLKKVANKHKTDFFVYADFGHYLKSPNIQLIGELNYSISRFETKEFNSQLISTNFGVTIEMAKNFILVLNCPIDLWGENVEKKIGVGLALTLMFD